MFQAFLIRLLAEKAFEIGISVLGEATKKSTNKVDDKLVKTLKDSKNDVMALLKKK